MLKELAWTSPVVCLFVVQIVCQVPGSFAAGVNCTGNVGKYLPDPQNIHKFYFCNGKAPLSYTCPKGQIFRKTHCVDGPTVTSTTNASYITHIVTTPSSPRNLSNHSSPSSPTSPISPSSSAVLPSLKISRFNCSRNNLMSMIRCFKNDTKAWKRYLKSPSGDPIEVLQSAVNKTKEIFQAFEQQRNSSGWFNPFDVLKILDNVGREVASKTNRTLTVSNKKMLIEVTPITPPYRFPDYTRVINPSNAWKDVSDLIDLPKGIFKSNIDNYAVSALYLDLLDKLPTNVFETNNSHVINSHVISSLVIPEVTSPFKNDVIITMKHLKKLRKDQYSVCAYWDFSIRTSKGNGLWSRRGCLVMSERSNSTHTTCSCNHLTNFAVLMGSESIPITKTHEVALSVITYIGCALSLFGSVAAITVLVILTKGLHSDRNIIHANLLISIAISQTVFLAGIEQTQDRTSCKLTAIMLHYFYLVSFAWMLCEGLHLYAMVIKVFNLTSRVYHYVAFSWVTPAIIVLITALSRFKEYGTNTSCWISGEYFTLLAFILPVAAILLVNIVILSLVMKEICLLHVSESSHISRMINSTFKTVVVLFPLLGITWVFGLLVFATKNIVFQYLFATLNTLQGFFIFILHCLFNSEIRKNFKRKKEVWKSLRVFEDFRRRVAVSIIPVRIPGTRGTTSSNERAETFEKSS